MKNTSKPTDEIYSLLQTVYDKFNTDLFSSKLPDVVLTLQREKNTMGYFSRDRWFRSKSNERVHEIAINPAYFANFPLIEILQTMAHEMCHLYQHEHGSPGRGRYHNAEFAQMMENIGLMASSTGRPGGKRTGQQMADYPIEGGHFASACLALHDNGFFLPWVDRFPATKRPSTLGRETGEKPGYQAGETSAEQHGCQQYQSASLEVLYVDLVPPNLTSEIVSLPDKEKMAKRHSKTKYQCGCGINVWGKPGLSIQCNLCSSDFFLND